MRASKAPHPGGAAALHRVARSRLVGEAPDAGAHEALVQAHVLVAVVVQDVVAVRAVAVVVEARHAPGEPPVLLVALVQRRAWPRPGSRPPCCPSRG